MNKKISVVFVMMCMLSLVSCDKLPVNSVMQGTDEGIEYDYREMYLNNDSKDLTDKDLEVFNAASKTYSLYMESCDTEYDMVVAAHDYIIENCVYNTDAIDNDTLNEDDFHPYGVFVKGTAVCEGYAESFKILMDIAGIDCIVVTGTVGENNIPHAWNMIKLDNEWYHVDVTYDDPNPETPEKVYIYLNITDEVIEKDHVWNKNVTPEADSDKYDYIKLNENMYGSNEQIDKLIKECNSEKATYVSFIWSGSEMIAETAWKHALVGTDITNLSFSCIGVEGRRMYMVMLSY